MDDGEIVETRPPDTFFTAPESERARVFLSKISATEPWHTKSRSSLILSPDDARAGAGEVQSYAKLVVLDTIGVILAGAERPEVRELRARLSATAGTGATVFAPGWPTTTANDGPVERHRRTIHRAR